MLYRYILHRRHHLTWLRIINRASLHEQKFTRNAGGTKFGTMALWGRIKILLMGPYKNPEVSDGPPVKINRRRIKNIQAPNKFYKRRKKLVRHRTIIYRAA